MKNTAELIYDISFLIRLYQAAGESNGNGKAGLSKLEVLVLEILDFKKTKMSISNFSDAYPTINTIKFSKTISNLWRKKLVEKKNDPEDQRRTIVELTEEGKKAVIDIKKGQMTLYEEVERGLSLDPKKDKPVYHAAVDRAIKHFDKLLKEKEKKAKEQAAGS